MGAVLAVLAVTGGCGGSDDGDPVAAPSIPSERTAQQVCDRLNGATVAGVTLSASVSAAGSGLPLHCKVNGLLLPQLNFELRFPDRWNGKTVYEGGGGFDGSIPVPNTGVLDNGYVMVASDSGHQASVVDATWALNDSRAAQLWGSQSVPTTMAAALEIVQAAYDTAPTRSYFEGCSNGGREGLMAVQRNPSLFDGVISRAPAYNIVGFFGHWAVRAQALSAPGGALSDAKVALFAKTIRDACDARDGIVDGIVANPAACTGVVDPAALRCTGGVDAGDTCLSDPQIASLQTIMSSARFGSGSTTFHDAARVPTGNEDDPGAWPTWITGNGNVAPTLSFLLTDSAVKSFIARDLAVDARTYIPYDQDINALFAFSTLTDATNADIRSYVNRGGKLILWHGGNDAAFSPLSTAEYYDAAVSALGGQALADRSVRYYVAPGVNHCTGGPGADRTDLLSALDAWVVNGSEPGVLVASKLDASGSTQFTRPLCRYPQYPRYTGPANDAAAAKLAANYTCASP